MENDFGLSEEMAKNSCDYKFPLLLFTFKITVQDIPLILAVLGASCGLWSSKDFDNLRFSEVKKLAYDIVSDLKELDKFKNTQGTVHIEINDRYELKAWVENGNSEN